MAHQHVAAHVFPCSARWSGLVTIGELAESDRYNMLCAFFTREQHHLATLKQVAACTHGFSYSQMLRLCHTMRRRRQRHGAMSGKDHWTLSVNEIYKGGRVVDVSLALDESDKDEWESVGGYESVKKASACRASATRRLDVWACFFLI